MKPTLLVSLALTAGLIAPTFAQIPTTPAPAAPAAPAHHGSRVSGRVTAVDTTAHTVTVEERNSTTPATFTLGPAATITRLVPAAVADLKAGEVVQVSGPVTGSTLEARNITVLLETPKGQGRGRSTVGTIATTTPALTLTGTDGTTYTITTTSRTRVETVIRSTADDITVGENVSARTHDRDGKLVASEVTIRPSRRTGATRLHFGGTAANIR